MFRFVLGVAAGWTAARSLPPRDVEPWSPPTTTEMAILAEKAKSAVLKLQKMLEEQDDDEHS